MATVRLTEQLRSEYQDLFDSCVIRASRLPDVEDAVRRISRHQRRYERVSAETGIPWHVIAVIHSLESNLDFNTHLHNGDPLSAQTTHVPAGRPPNGQPPFSWEESATDALEYDRFTTWTDWSVPGTLYKLEGYNGWGYRRYHPDVLSPYLWSFSEHYTRGKYGADGKWNGTLVSRQCGGAVILRRMLELQLISASSIPALGAPIGRGAQRGRRTMVSSRELRRIQLALNAIPNVYVPIEGRMNAQTRALLTRLGVVQGSAKRAKRTR